MVELSLLSAHARNHQGGCPGLLPVQCRDPIELISPGSPEKQERRERVGNGSASAGAAVHEVLVSQRVAREARNKSVQIDALRVSQHSLGQRWILQHVLQQNVHVGGQQYRRLAFFEVFLDKGQDVRGDILRFKYVSKAVSVVGRVHKPLVKDLPFLVCGHQTNLLDIDEVRAGLEKSVVIQVNNEHRCLSLITGHDYLISRGGTPGWSNV